MEDVIKLLENEIIKIDAEISHNDQLIYNHHECKTTLEILNKRFTRKKFEIQNAIAQLELTN
jgi:hypothetical protein